ncbi:hypothetical protein PGTUg99_026792 [Puccinia graminis f. sp. tritici]|uniref:Uncharacterized protein n=1 Tax=Puccinia graminis f. sp. tritici TaxID=56615 RepID=A0A5B0NJ84_PUCGR|nr:hypothetical protein PGTUg99_026792 [Puccinia graminis f. sp. tritici]
MDPATATKTLTDSPSHPREQLIKGLAQVVMAARVGGVDGGAIATLACFQLEVIQQEKKSGPGLVLHSTLHQNQDRIPSKNTSVSLKPLLLLNPSISFQSQSL